MVNADLIFRNLAEELVHVGDARGLVLQEPTVAIQYRSLQIYNSDLRIQRRPLGWGATRQQFSKNKYYDCMIMSAESATYSYVQR